MIEAAITLSPMPASSRDDLRRLHFIDSLFAHLTGHDLYLAHQIKEAIAFSLADLERRTQSNPESVQTYDQAFNAAAADLLAKLFSHVPRHGFYHWDASLGLAAATPLFTRAEVMQGLKHLAPFRESTLLVTNLRPALIPATRRSSQRRRNDYQEALAFIRDLAVARTRKNHSLQLLFL